MEKDVLAPCQHAVLTLRLKDARVSSDQMGPAPQTQLLVQVHAEL